jgi:hypothetical protein
VFDAKGHKIGDYVNVKVLSCTSATLISEIVEEEPSHGMKLDLKELFNNLINSKNDKN